MLAPNGSTIKTFGERMLFVDIGLEESLPWNFVIAEVSIPILGADFLSHYDLTVSMRKQHLFHEISGTVITAINTTVQQETRLISHIDHLPECVELLLQKYSEITKEASRLDEVKHPFVHRIITKEGCNPVSVKPRRVSLKLQDEAQNILQKLLMEGTITRASGSWSSPMHLVPKKNGETWRLVTDYRQLNSITKPDKYPLPYMRDFTSRLHDKKCFSAIDLKDAFLQLPVAPEDIEKTTVSTPFGNFQYHRMPFGLSNASQSFQRFIDFVLNDLAVQEGPDQSSRRKVSLFAYVDDILVSSRNQSEHLADLDALFQRLTQYGLRINLKKCTFMTNELEFLGHKVSENGTSPLPDKVQAVKEYEKPHTAKGLRRFLGLVNFYRQYIQNAADVLAPLSGMLAGHGSKLKKLKLKWTDEAECAFEHAKSLLSEATLLHYPTPNCITSVAVDASDVAVGGVLQQFVDDAWLPISFFSKKLSKGQIKYSTFSKELLAAYLSIKHFRPYIEGTQFHILTDNMALMKAIHKRGTRDLPREERQLEYVAIFTTDIRHIKGSENVVADALTRQQDNEHAKDEPPDDDVDALGLFAIFSNALLDRMPSALDADIELRDILNGKYKSVKLQKTGSQYYDDSGRLYIPQSMRKDVFHQFHDVAHPGIRASKRHLVRKYLWPRIDKEVIS